MCGVQVVVWDFMAFKSKEAQAAYHRGWYKKNKKRRIELVKAHVSKLSNRIREYKLTQGCVECGYKDHFAALDFDHVRGEKLYNVSSMPSITGSWRLILEEIAKCDVVCSNCHRIRTFNRL